MQRLPFLRILDMVEATLEQRRPELDSLDAALGDGDHGSRLARAAQELRSRHAEIACLPLGEALARIAAILREQAGGSGGRIYGAVLEGMGRAAPVEELSLAVLQRMLAAGIGTARREGGMKRGDKTLLDVLIPVAEALERHSGDDPERVGDGIISAAAHAMHETRDLPAAWEPACRRAGRGVGHIDPGACSAALITGAVIDALSSAEAF